MRKGKKRVSIGITRSVFCLLLLLGVIFLLARNAAPKQLFAAASPSSLYWGVYQLGMVSYRKDVSPLTKFETDAGKGVSLVHLFQSWGDPTSQTFNSVLMDAIRNHGSIPLITWNSAAEPITANQPQYSLQNIVNGNFDTYITQFAQAAKAWGHPFFLRLDQEMDLGWAPWDETYEGVSVNGNKPGQYVAMWRHVWNIFNQVGAKNVTWVWCPSRVGSLATYKELYPGNAFVDWTCTDVYNMPHTGSTTFTWQTFSQLFGSAYTNLLQVASKPIMIAEVGSYESPTDPQAKANWITDMLTTQLPTRFPDVKAFVWWNVNTNTDIESSAASQQAFANAVQNPIYTANTYGTISVSPLLPPT